jgi:hypothetical protein
VKKEIIEALKVAPAWLKTTFYCGCGDFSVKWEFIVTVYLHDEKRSNTVSELYPTGRAALRDNVYIRAREGRGRIAPVKAFNARLSVLAGTGDSYKGAIVSTVNRPFLSFDEKEKLCPSFTELCKLRAFFSAPLESSINIFFKLDFTHL